MLIMKIANNSSFTIDGTGESEGISIFCDYVDICISAQNDYAWLPNIRTTVKGLDRYLAFLESSVVALKETKKKLEENK
jgi:hypothetical protein